jgi:hypothetical protein
LGIRFILRAMRLSAAGRGQEDPTRPRYVHCSKNQELPAHVGDWPPEWLEAYIERAGIMEFDGGLPRIEAERRAEELVRETYRRTGACQ